MTIFKTWPNGAVGLVQFKWNPRGVLFTHVTKSNWRIPSFTEIPMTIWFDKGDRNGTGTVIEDQTGGSTIETGINIDDAEGFMEDVANAKEMTITFNSGTEKPWVTSMVGSRKATEAFHKCVDWLKINGPTQPDAQSSAPAPTAPPLTFVIPSDVSAGHMNVRKGPGSNHQLLGSIPAGQTVTASRCAPRDDGIVGADWCLVTWRNLNGWVSRIGLMPVEASVTQPTQPMPPVQPTDDRKRVKKDDGSV